ncbi:MAG: hypothetical protein ABI835_06375, partial [Chloroflexota bacterium]
MGNTLQRVQPILRIAAFLTMLALCVWAQSEFLARSAAGYLWLGAACGLAALVIRPKARPDWRWREAGSLDAAEGWRRWSGVILLIAGVILSADSLRIFHAQLLVTPYPNEIPWIHYGIGLALALVGGLLLVGIGRLPRPDVTIWLLVGVVALALFVRVYRVDVYPFGVWYDEADWGLQARAMLEHADFRPIFVPNITFPNLAAYAWSLEIFGRTSIVGPRVVTALLVSLGVPLAYLVGRELLLGIG